METGGQTLGKNPVVLQYWEQLAETWSESSGWVWSAGWAPLRPPIAVYQATTGAPGYYPTAPQRQTKSQDSAKTPWGGGEGAGGCPWLAKKSPGA